MTLKLLAWSQTQLDWNSLVYNYPAQQLKYTLGGQVSALVKETSAIFQGRKGWSILFYLEGLTIIPSPRQSTTFSGFLLGTRWQLPDYTAAQKVSYIFADLDLSMQHSINHQKVFKTLRDKWVVFLGWRATDAMAFYKGCLPTVCYSYFLMEELAVTFRSCKQTDVHDTLHCSYLSVSCIIQDGTVAQWLSSQV